MSVPLLLWAMAYVSDEGGQVNLRVALVGHPGAGAVKALAETFGRIAPETRGAMRHGVLRSGRFASFDHRPLGARKIRGRVLRVEVVGGDVGETDELSLLLREADAVVVMGYDAESLAYQEGRAARALSSRRCLPAVPRVYALSATAKPGERDAAAGLLEIDPADIEEGLPLALRTATEVALRGITRPRRSPSLRV